MNLSLKNLYSSLKKLFGIIQSFWMGRKQKRFMLDLSLSDASAAFDINTSYAYFHHYFFHLLPKEIRVHRSYFKVNSRGFGEDAMHAMWFVLLKTYQPKRCLEIGVYKGQVISLWSLISKMLNLSQEIYAISPFNNAGDSVSYYANSTDYFAETILNHKYFDLPLPSLLIGLSNDPLAEKLIQSKTWDMIYIDGSHDYNIALGDYLICRENLTEGGLLVIDDSSLYNKYHPPLFSFAGHPGPSRIAKENASEDLFYIGTVGHNNVFMKKKI